MNKENGLKQQIKNGEISPVAAIKRVLQSEGHSKKFVRWARETGNQRYKQALAEKSKLEKPTPKKKSKKKG